MTVSHVNEYIIRKILLIRGKKVMLDSDLSELYGVETKVLNQAVKRNIERFPDDFMFRLNETEKQEVVTKCDHLAKLKFSATTPFAFTEHGALMLGNVLRSKQAVEISLMIVRTFVQIREMLASHKELAARIEALENRVGKQDESIDSLIGAIRQMMIAPEPRKRPIGFVIDDDSFS